MQLPIDLHKHSTISRGIFVLQALVFIDYVRNSQGTGGKASEGREKSSLVEGLLIGIIHDGSWRNRDRTRSVHE